MTSSSASISIIVPAHNEAKVIHRLLSALTTGPLASLLEVIVVCNGCTDNTAEIANDFGVIVLDCPVASKTAALNFGDAAATHYPRAYVDADIIVSCEAIKACADALTANPNLKSVAPQIDINTEGAPYGVQAFYRSWTQLPYFSSQDMVGSGFFMLSEAGRKSFDQFPEIIGDDAYIRSLFPAAERATITSATFTIFAPRTLKDLINIKIRSRLGNIEVQHKYPTHKTLGTNKPFTAISLLASKPNLIPDFMVYYYVVLQSILGCRRRVKAGDFNTWERDESSRGG